MKPFITIMKTKTRGRGTVIHTILEVSLTPLKTQRNTISQTKIWASQTYHWNSVAPPMVVEVSYFSQSGVIV